MLREMVTGAGCVLAGMALAAPEAAAQRSLSPLEETCEEVVRGGPSGPARKEAAPPDGATVAPGQGVDVTITWPAGNFPGDTVHKVLDCVTVNGVLAPELSAERRDSANDGVFTHRFAIPAEAKPGTEVCDRGFVAGMGLGEVFSRNKTNEVCHTVDGPPAAHPVPPMVETDDVEADEEEEGDGASRTFQGVVLTPPEPAPAPAVAPPRPAPVGLPLTGGGDLAMVLGGTALALGGAALMAGAPRPPAGGASLLHQGHADATPSSRGDGGGRGTGHRHRLWRLGGRR